MAKYWVSVEVSGGPYKGSYTYESLGSAMSALRNNNMKPVRDTFFELDVLSGETVKAPMQLIKGKKVCTNHTLTFKIKPTEDQ
jgi:hypothetical protein